MSWPDGVRISTFTSYVRYTCKVGQHGRQQTRPCTQPLPVDTEIANTATFPAGKKWLILKKDGPGQLPGCRRDPHLLSIRRVLARGRKGVDARTARGRVSGIDYLVRASRPDALVIELGRQAECVLGHRPRVACQVRDLPVRYVLRRRLGGREGER
jgi:hypothetical protein